MAYAGPLLALYFLADFMAFCWPEVIPTNICGPAKDRNMPANMAINLLRNPMQVPARFQWYAR